MPSSIISDQAATNLVDNFLDTVAQGQTTSHIFNTADLFAFVSDVENNVAAGTKEKGVAFRFGKPTVTGFIQIGMEAVLYERNSGNGQIRNYEYADDSSFYGRLSTDFSINLQTGSERSDFNTALDINDSSGVLLALINFDVFKEFLGTSTDFHHLKIDFARNSSGQLTVVLSRRASNGSGVASTVSTNEGLYLDDHDLIPPPD